MQALIDRMEELDPATAHVLVDNPGGIDTLLFQFPAFNDDPAANKVLQEEIEELWAGDDEAITATSLSLVSVTVTDAITNRQTEAITTTVGVALAVLGIFFWVTLRQPILAVFAVGPIVLVLIWVLGTMALLDIPYSLVTSIITALSIGIGVDYTIHIIHRYREEFTRLRSPGKGGDQYAGYYGLRTAGISSDHGSGVGCAGVLAAGCVPGLRDYGGDYHRLLADSVDPGCTDGDDGVGRVPEHAAALHGGADVDRPGRGDRGHSPPPRTGTGITIGKQANATP